MSYEDYRKQQIQAFLHLQLRRFLDGFNPHSPTVILLPGGMGSELARTRRPFNEAAPPNPNPIDDTIWMDIGVVFNSDALKLEIRNDLRDYKSFVVTADGPVCFASLTPYDDFLDFAKSQNWNIVVFGYDWRRPLQESADFLKFFVDEFRRRVIAAHQSDPLPDTNLVAHSMGGTVVTLALQNPQFFSLPFHSIVTVATPFYGTATHQDRYYIGEKMLNVLYGADVVAPIIASLPGPYSLMFLPKVIYDRDRDLIPDLEQYPVIDSHTGQAADPFDPALVQRWPSAVRRCLGYIADNRAALLKMTKPIDTEIKKRFFNVRASGTPTANYLLWEDVDGDDVSPTAGKSPLGRIPGPGDGTVPAWSAFHAYSLTANRRELTKAKDHGLLFEHPEVMGVIEAIISGRKTVSRAIRKAKRPARVASLGRAQKVLKQAKSLRERGKPPPPDLFTAPVVRAIYKKIIW